MNTVIPTILTIIFILISHFIADFIFQTNNMAENKSSSNIWLSKHIVSYTTVLFLSMAFFNFMFLDFSYYSIIVFSLVNGAIHFIVDYITSRATKRLYEENRMHDFFVVIGLDQLIHNITLLLSAYLIFF